MTRRPLTAVALKISVYVLGGPLVRLYFLGPRKLTLEADDTMMNDAKMKDRKDNKEREALKCFLPIINLLTAKDRHLKAQLYFYQ
jgi:hypothetical protein